MDDVWESKLLVVKQGHTNVDKSIAPPPAQLSFLYLLRCLCKVFRHDSGFLRFMERSAVVHGQERWPMARQRLFVLSWRRLIEIRM